MYTFLVALNKLRERVLQRLRKIDDRERLLRSRVIAKMRKTIFFCVILKIVRS